MNKPQEYEGILQNEAIFSDKLKNIWNIVVDGMSTDQRNDVLKLIHQAYKEGYADAWEKAIFMMK